MWNHQRKKRNKGRMRKNRKEKKRRTSEEEELAGEDPQYVYQRTDNWIDDVPIFMRICQNRPITWDIIRQPKLDWE